MNGPLIRRLGWGLVAITVAGFALASIGTGSILFGFVWLGATYVGAFAGIGIVHTIRLFA